MEFQPFVVDINATNCSINGKKNDQLFIYRIKASTKKKIVSQHAIPADGIVFFDGMVLLGTAGINQSQRNP
jgi:hypothetical protein